MLFGISEMCKVIDAEKPKPQSRERELLEEIKRLREELTKQPEDVSTSKHEIESEASPETETPTETETETETEIKED